MRAVALVALLIAVSLAGCGEPAPSAFDGAAALAFVDDLVYDADGLRPRVPDRDRSATYDWLVLQMSVPGWSVDQVNFGGDDITPAMTGTVSRWVNSCSASEQAAVADLQLANFYAHREGPAGSKTIMLAAHWDAKKEARGGGVVPAANDGASGVGLLLQMQRELAGVELPFGITIAFFDAEDGFEDCHPLWGSIYHANYEDLPDLLILLDMVGDADARFVRESRSVASAPTIVQRIWSLAGARGMADHFTTESKSIDDDHAPFVEKGVPAVDIIDAGRPTTFPPYWHTTGDTPDKLSAEMLGDMGGLLVALLTDGAFQGAVEAL